MSVWGRKRACYLSTRGCLEIVLKVFFEDPNPVFWTAERTDEGTEQPPRRRLLNHYFRVSDLSRNGLRRGEVIANAPLRMEAKRAGNT
jgi:hypothetical protein